MSPKTDMSAIESNNNALNNLKEKFSLIKISSKYTEDIFQLNESHDVITALQCVEHLDYPLTICKGIYQKLNSNGIFLLTIPNRFSYETLLKRKNNLCYANILNLIIPLIYKNILNY